MGCQLLWFLGTARGYRSWARTSEAWGDLRYRSCRRPRSLHPKLVSIDAGDMVAFQGLTAYDVSCDIDAPGLPLLFGLLTYPPP